QFRLFFLAVAGLLFTMSNSRLWACELCAIYSANSAQSDSSSGFLFTIAEQYVAQHTLQVEGHPVSGVPFYNDAFLNSSYTHIVPGYNFSSRVGVSLNAPIVYRDFHRTQQASPSGTIYDESGTLLGLGDIALIGRLGLVQQVKM